MEGYSILKKIRTTDLITLCYLIITVFYIMLLDGFSELLWEAVVNRIGILLIMIFAIYFEYTRNNGASRFLHLFYPILLMTYFYGETASLNHLIFNENLDGIIYSIEQQAFGYQPSIEFSRTFPQQWISELLYFGYFSLYLMTFGVTLVFFLKKPKSVERIIFLIITSFFIYYLVFIIIPVVGPQYYFQTPLNEMEDSGFFSSAVKLIQHYGEKPTGAFPSSHVGMVLIYLYLSYRNIRWLFWVILPLFILIIFATVYIKAHYVVDVIAGLISAPIIYYLAGILYRLVRQKTDYLCR